MAKKVRKNVFNITVITEMQIKTIMAYHFTPVRMVL